MTRSADRRGVSPHGSRRNGVDGAPDPSARRALADVRAVDLVEAATHGGADFRDAWSRVPVDSVEEVLDALQIRVMVDDVRRGAHRPGDEPNTLAPGERAARAAFQIAASLVAASIARHDPDLVPRRLDALRRSAVNAPETERYARQMVCEPEARQVGAAIIKAVLEGRGEDARYLIDTTTRDLAEAVLHVTVDALAELLSALGAPASPPSIEHLPPRLRAEMAVVRADLWGRPSHPARLVPVVLTDALLVADVFVRAAVAAPHLATAILDRLRTAGPQE